jgi:hypothetical protein
MTPPYSVVACREPEADVRFEYETGVHFKGWEKEQEPQNCTSYLETKMEK